MDRRISRAGVDGVGRRIRVGSRAARIIGAVVGGMLLAAGASAQPGAAWPNDGCATPTPIGGEGSFWWSTFGATPSPEPGGMCRFGNDLWYCYTATCDGVLTVTTCPYGADDGTVVTQTMADTVIAIYDGCGCPMNKPVCCDDNAQGCAPQSLVTCDVQCGHQYMIRIGTPLGVPGGSGTFRVTCEGKPCPPVPDRACTDCCGTRPAFNDPFYQSNFTGQVAVMTDNDENDGPSAYKVVTIFDLSCSNPPPVGGQEWNPVPGAPTTGFRYSRDDWTKAKLGSVFGVTLDGSGSIYVAHSAIYGTIGGSPFDCTRNATAIGNAGSSLPNTSTSVFKIPSGTGVPEVFVNLPGGSSATTDPGLGNLSFDCEHSQFYVSHFGDGRIYRVSQSGVILGWFDHATNTVGLGSAPDAAGPYRDFVPLGERVWAVQAHNGRLYYSVWGQNKNNFAGPFSVVGTVPNRIWSIAIAPGLNGNFVAGSRQQEIQPASHPGNTYMPASLGICAPTSDISFSPTCRMLLAERDMSASSCTLAHGSRALEYSLVGTQWVPSSNFRSGLGYQVGEVIPALRETNSAGGCDYDFANPDTCAAGRLWVTGDALTYNSTGGRVYGMSGMLTNTPFGSATSFFVDYNSAYSNGSFDKTHQGDVELPCVCVAINDVRLLCDVGATPPTGNYNYTFTFTNNSGQPVQFIFFQPSSGITPLSIALPTPVPVGGTSPPINVVISGHQPGERLCFDVTFANPEIRECCRVTHCVELPRCDCEQFLECQVTCDPAGTGYTLTFTLQNLSPGPINEMHIFALPIGSGVFASPQDFYFASVPQYGVAGPFTTSIQGPVTPGPLCLRISIHNNGVQCCSEDKCITLPSCWRGNPCPGDFNGDGVVTSQDFFDFLTAFFAGSMGADFNHNGVVNSQDFFDYISAFFTPC